jgi:NADPH:quinone reductase-like Zn-dependent oxidoreductase
MFQALVLEKNPEFSATVREVDEGFLPEGDVTVAVEYSTLNFKDGLAITNRSPVVRSWPMVAGIDGSGTVLESSSPAWKAGDAFVLNGFGVGETHKGCLAGWCAGPLPSMRAKPWRSAPPATRRCCACWRWSATASRPAMAKCW